MSVRERERKKEAGSRTLGVSEAPGLQEAQRDQRVAPGADGVRLNISRMRLVRLYLGRHLSTKTDWTSHTTTDSVDASKT